MMSQDQVSNKLYLHFGTFLKSTKYKSIRIEKLDRYI
jgi:hypothetical protein